MLVSKKIPAHIVMELAAVDGALHHRRQLRLTPHCEGHYNHRLSIRSGNVDKAESASRLQAATASSNSGTTI